MTEHPVNFRELGYEGRLDDGNYGKDAIFSTVSYAATRAIKVRRREDPADQVVIGGQDREVQVCLLAGKRRMWKIIALS